MFDQVTVMADNNHNRPNALKITYARLDFENLPWSDTPSPLRWVMGYHYWIIFEILKARR